MHSLKYGIMYVWVCCGGTKKQYEVITLKCYDCKKEIDFAQGHITFKNNIEVVMCGLCAEKYRDSK